MNKAILVIAALFVATAAAGPLVARFGKQQQLQEEENIYGRFLPRLLGHPLERSLIYGESLRVPSFLRDDIFDVNVIQLENLILHPLFPVYMGLPYFQQFWSDPMFQRYVCSQYFQRFWELPSFHQYFVNPVLFYKYIFPLVTLFKYDSSSPVAYGFPYNAVNYRRYPLHIPSQLQYQQQLPLNMETYYKNLLKKTNSNLENSRQVQAATTEVEEVTPEVETDTVNQETVVDTTTAVVDHGVQRVSDDAKVNADETSLSVETVEDEDDDDDESEDKTASSTTTSATIISSSTVLPEQQEPVISPYIYNDRNVNNYPVRRYQFNPLANMFQRYYH